MLAKITKYFQLFYELVPFFFCEFLTFVSSICISLKRKKVLYCGKINFLIGREVLI
jgi:hypothetical protein